MLFFRLTQYHYVEGVEEEVVDEDKGEGESDEDEDEDEGDKKSYEKALVSPKGNRPSSFPRIGPSSNFCQK